MPVYAFRPKDSEDLDKYVAEVDAALRKQRRIRGKDTVYPFNEFHPDPRRTILVPLKRPLDEKDGKFFLDQGYEIFEHYGGCGHMNWGKARFALTEEDKKHWFYAGLTERNK